MDQGFWKDHLRGKQYHIRYVTAFVHCVAKLNNPFQEQQSSLTSNLLLFSALYVVDLNKFRETAAGDNLRVFYESLSKDPNSLSNLDQVGGLSSRCSMSSVNFIFLNNFNSSYVSNIMFSHCLLNNYLLLAFL